MNLPPIRYIQSGPMAPEASASAAMAPARGAMQVGKAIEGIGEDFMRLAQQNRETKEATIRADFFNDAETQATDFKNGLLSRSDYDKWTGDFDMLANRMEGDKRLSGLSPAGRSIFQQQWSDWRSKQMNQLSTTAALKTVTDGRLAAANTIQMGVDTGDRDTVQRGIEEGRRMGMSPAELDKAGTDAEGQINVGILSDMIDSDPDGWKARLEDPDTLRKDYPNVSDYDIEKLRRRTENREQEMRAEEMDALDVKARSEQGLKQEDIDQSRFLTDKDRAIYTERLKDSTPPSAEDESRAWAMTDALRAARTDPSVSQDAYRKIYNETRSAVLGKIPHNFQGDLKRELGFLSPAGRDPSTPTVRGPISREDIEALGREQIDLALQNEVFGKIGKDATAAEKEAAHAKARQLRIDMMRDTSGFDPNDPATPGKMKDYVDGKISGNRTGEASAKARTMVPGTGSQMQVPRRKMTGKSAVPFGQLPKTTAPGDVLPPLDEDGADAELNRMLEEEGIPKPAPPDYLSK